MRISLHFICLLIPVYAESSADQVARYGGQNAFQFQTTSKRPLVLFPSGNTVCTLIENEVFCANQPEESGSSKTGHNQKFTNHGFTTNTKFPISYQYYDSNWREDHMPDFYDTYEDSQWNPSNADLFPHKVKILQQQQKLAQRNPLTSRDEEKYKRYRKQTKGRNVKNNDKLSQKRITYQYYDDASLRGNIHEAYDDVYEEDNISPHTVESNLDITEKGIRYFGPNLSRQGITNQDRKEYLTKRNGVNGNKKKVYQLDLTRKRRREGTLIGRIKDLNENAKNVYYIDGTENHNKAVRKQSQNGGSLVRTSNRSLEIEDENPNHNNPEFVKDKPNIIFKARTEATAAKNKKLRYGYRTNINTSKSSASSKSKSNNSLPKLKYGVFCTSDGWCRFDENR